LTKLNTVETFFRDNFQACRGTQRRTRTRTRAGTKTRTTPAPSASSPPTSTAAVAAPFSIGGPLSFQISGKGADGGPAKKMIIFTTNLRRIPENIENIAEADLWENSRN